MNDEDEHLDQTEDAVALQPRRPREDEHGLDVEHDEEQGEHVVADLALGPQVPTGSTPLSYVLVLLGLGPVGPQQAAQRPA